MSSVGLAARGAVLAVCVNPGLQGLGLRASDSELYFPSAHAVNAISNLPYPAYHCESCLRNNVYLGHAETRRSAKQHTAVCSQDRGSFTVELAEIN